MCEFSIQGQNVCFENSHQPLEVTPQFLLVFMVIKYFWWLDGFYYRNKKCYLVEMSYSREYSRVLRRVASIAELRVIYKRRVASRQKSSRVCEYASMRAMLGPITSSGSHNYQHFLWSIFLAKVRIWPYIDPKLTMIGCLYIKKTPTEIDPL